VAGDGGYLIERPDGARLSVGAGSFELIGAEKLAPRLELAGRSKAAGDRALELRYLTGGLRWHAEYVIDLAADGAGATLTGWLALANSTAMAFADTTWRFAAVEDRTADGVQPARATAAVLYRPLAPARFALAAHESVRLALVRTDAVDVATQLVFNPLTPGPAAAAAPQDVQRVARLSLTGDQAQRALPPGSLRVLIRRANGAVEQLPAADIDGFGAGRTLDLPLGPAPGLRGERRQTPFTQIVGQQAQEQQITVRITSQRKTAATVFVVEHPWGNWEIPKSSVGHRELDRETIVFPVEVPPGKTATVTYTLRIGY
jgi:hypothetical protein